AGAATKLYKSANGGASWTPLTRGLAAAGIAALAVDPRSRSVYAATATTSIHQPHQPIFRSDDEGAQWTEVNGVTLRYTYLLAVAPDRKGTVWAASIGGVFRSVDRGRTWSEADAGLLPAASMFAVLPGAASLLAGTSAGVFRSSDQGSSWS